MSFKSVVGLVLVLLVAVFCVQNSEVISVRFFGWHFESSLALLILVTAIAGALFGLLIGAFRGRGKSNKPKPEV